MKVALRQKKLLEMFKYTSGYMTVEYLSKELQVSKRTIHSDLQRLESKGISFEKKPGVGIRLCSVPSEQEAADLDPFSPEYRRKQLIKELLFLGQTITYQSLSERFMVSPSSIIADINHIKKYILKDSGTELIGVEQGTLLQGSEAQWQKTMIACNEYLLKSAGLSFREEKGRNLLCEFYNSELVETCYHITNSLREYNIYYVADYYLSNVFNVLLVLVHRLSEHHHHIIEHNEFYSDQIMTLMCYTVAKDLLELVTKNHHITFETSDVYFLSIYLKANRITFKTTTTNLGSRFEKIVRDMIERMSNCANVELQNDNELYENIYLHLIPMIHRLKNNIYIENPMLDEIKKEFHLMFELTWLVVDSLTKELNIAMTEDEVGFLMLHFQNALEKQKKSKRILVVCPNGVATSTLIANRIRQVLPPLDIIEVASLEEVETFEYSNIDFIVSTVPLNVKGVLVVVVSMLLNTKDLDQIEEVYKSKLLLPLESGQNFKNKELEKYLSPKHIFFHKGKCTKEEVIQTVCQKLKQDGMVESGFQASIFEREKEGGTDNAFGGALPHGAVSTVKQTCLAVWVNDEPIKWTKYRVKVIVFFALSEKDMKNTKKVLENGFSMIKSKEIVDKLSAAKTKEQLIAYITGGIKVD